MTEAEMIAALAKANRNQTNSVDPEPFSKLDRAAAYRIQSGVVSELGARIGMIKAAIQDGVGVAAPILSPQIVGGGHKFSGTNMAGLEVEIGVLLGKDIHPDTECMSAIDHFFLGVEIVGSRYNDTAVVGPNAGLADNLSNLGYAIGPEPRQLRDEVEGLSLTVELSGVLIHHGPARNGFGSVLASLEAYAQSQEASLPLVAGMRITTGSLCGLVPILERGHILAQLGADSVELDLLSV